VAIVGFLVHAAAADCKRVEAALAAMPEINTYGIHQNCYIVGVAEAPAVMVEGILKRGAEIEGVLAAYITSMTVEDETLPQD
jgi:nitrate reductase NapAB chaperone NapD